MSTEALARDTRYEGRWVLGELDAIGNFTGQGYATRCRSCGSLVAVGSEDLHERLHPRISCQRAFGDMGCERAGTRHSHGWDEQFR
jgi:DNA-directed RNA polymerase subunit N (RpoN/RPB10)